MLADEPPYLSVGTEVSAKYKGAFCEAKVRKVDKTVKCKVSFKLGCGTYTVLDSSIKGTLRVGAQVEAKHPEKKEFFEATITKIQDCSQYTVVFDDGDITTLRRSALCLKSGRHFAESETLDQLPLTHPEHFGNPVVGGGGRRGRRRLLDDSSGDEENSRKGKTKEEKEADIGKVVCVELGDKKKMKDNWFPGLVVSPNAQDTVQIRVKDEYLIRSFSDGRYYTVPKKETSEFTREIGVKVDNNTLKTAVEKALHFIDKDELPPHWDRELLFGLIESDSNSDSDEALDSDSSDDEPREEKDHFVAQLYKFMDDRGTPINNCPSIGGKDLDLYKLFNVVHKLNGYNRVTNRNQWKIVSTKLGLGVTASTITQVKHAYKKYLHSFEDFYRKLGCTMVSHPRSNRARNKSGRSLIRDRDRTTPSNPLKVNLSSFDSAKSNLKNEENAEKEGTVEGKAKDEFQVDKKEEKAKGKEEETTTTPATAVATSVPDKIFKGKNGKKEMDVEEVSESEDSVSVSEEAYTVNRPTSSLRKKFPTLKASPVVVREKRKADESPDGRKCKRMRMLKSRSSSGSDIKNASDGEEDSKSKEFPSQRNTTRSRSKDDLKAKKDADKEKKGKPATVNNVDNQKKAASAKKRNENEEPQSVKKGRKRRNTETGGKSPSTAEEDLNLPCLPSYKSVFIGDVLKIYYGAPGETKVIYEAKVVDIKENDTGETMYLVHYAGWNSRYDEWVKRNKIADNLNWTPARSKVVPVTKAAKTSAMKRKSGKSDQLGPGTRSTTPSSVTSTSSRHKSPAAPTPSGGKRITRNTGDTTKLTKRTRRVSNHTDLSIESDSDSDPGASVSDAESSKKPAKEEIVTRPMKKLVKKTPTKKKPVRKVEEKTPEGNEDETGKSKRTKKGSIAKEKDSEEKKNSSESQTEMKDLDEPKGRDFDLNEIRSELKGIDKAVKTNNEMSMMEPTEEKEKVEGDEKQVAVPEQPVPTMVEPPKEEEKPIIKPEEKSPEKKDLKDDIYEFKEPEPFDYQEVLRPMNRMFEEGERSPDKSVKKPSAGPEKKEISKSEADLKSRFKKTIGKKMKDVSSPESKKDSTLKNEKLEVFSTRCWNFEEEPVVLKVETEVGKPQSLSPEAARLHSAVQEEVIEKKMESPRVEKELPSKPLLEVESCKSLITSKPSPEPPNLGMVANSTFAASARSPASPLLGLMNEEGKPQELKKGENAGAEEEDDPISAAIQRVIAQSSMDDDSDEMELFGVSTMTTPTAKGAAAQNVAVISTSNPPSEEAPDVLQKQNLAINESKSELLITKKVCSKRKSVGKRIMLSKEFVMDDSSTDSDSDSAEERLVIVNEDESTNDSSQKNAGVNTEDEKKAPTQAAEGKTKKTEERKSPTPVSDSSLSKKINPGDSTLIKKATPVVMVAAAATAPPATSTTAVTTGIVTVTTTITGVTISSSTTATITTPAITASSSISATVTSVATKPEEWKSQKAEKPTEEEGENNIQSLLCEETIPGSPAPLMENKETAEPKMNALEMQFPNSSHSESLPAAPLTNGKAEGNDANAVMDNTPPTTPESNLSSMSGSPRDDRVGSSSLDNESSKSLRDSSEIDVDNEPDQRMKNLKFSKKPDKDAESPLKKKWRNRKRSESLSEVGKRMRQPVGRPPKAKDLGGSDSDDTSENSQTGTHNVNTETLINSRSQKPSKYNFYCELDPELDANQRIALLEQKLQECRKTYLNVKSKLASLDRRRKKLRRREREEKGSATFAARNPSQHLRKFHANGRSLPNPPGNSVLPLLLNFPQQ